jgi:hypothetical protein
MPTIVHFDIATDDWGRMSIVDTKHFMLPLIRRSIYEQRPLVTGTPV